MLFDLLCPVEVRGTVVKTNSETNVPYLLLKLFNKSDKIIDTLTLNVKVYDATGTELASLPVEFTELSANPKEYFAETKAISLEEIPDAQNFVVEILTAVYDDGEQYEYSEENLVDCDTSEAALADALKLRESFPDAVCFAAEYEKYWRCACGTPNHIDAENCNNCDSTKEYMLTNFSSIESLEAMIAKQKEAEEAEKAAKKAKTKKTITTTIIVIVALAVIGVAGYFAKNLVFGLMGNSAAKSGDFAKAYNLYSKANSAKASEYEKYAMGNTPSNLMFGNGFSAEDAENTYFLAFESNFAGTNLIKENKQTGEKTILTDAAASCLNVSGDYIYFINNEFKPCRMTKDGANTEIILDKQLNYICVIGNDMYYLGTDYDNDGNLTDEQLQALAMQGQITAYQRIHKYNIDSKKDVTISTEEVSAFSIYNGRIYYLSTDNADDTWSKSNLCSMKADGSDIKKHVEAPVMTFHVDGEDIYYVPHYTANAKGVEQIDISHLNYTVEKLNTTTGEITTVTPLDDMVLSLNASGDCLYFMKYSRAEYIDYSTPKEETEETENAEEQKMLTPSLVSFNLKDGKETILVTGEVAAFNVSGDNVFCVFPYQGMARLKTDGSGFESVYADGTSTPPVTEEESTELSPDLQALAEDLEAQENAE